MSKPTPWYRTGRGLLVVAAYAALTILAVVVSTGWSVPDGFFAFSEAGAGDGSPTTRVPPFVYLYAFLGAMTYAFTSVIAKFERGVPGVLRAGIRALAALPLAAGVFLLAGLLGVDPSNGRVLAGLAFLVGLYVNLTLKALGGLAEQIYGRVRTPPSTPDPEDSSEAEGARTR